MRHKCQRCYLLPLGSLYQRKSLPIREKCTIHSPGKLESDPIFIIRARAALGCHRRERNKAVARYNSEAWATSFSSTRTHPWSVRKPTVRSPYPAIEISPSSARLKDELSYIRFSAVGETVGIRRHVAMLPRLQRDTARSACSAVPLPTSSPIITRTCLFSVAVNA